VTWYERKEKSDNGPDLDPASNPDPDPGPSSPCIDLIVFMGSTRFHRVQVLWGSDPRKRCCVVLVWSEAVLIAVVVAMVVDCLADPTAKLRSALVAEDLMVLTG
jgi:hypothetical protein